MTGLQAAMLAGLGLGIGLVLLLVARLATSPNLSAAISILVIAIAVAVHTTARPANSESRWERPQSYASLSEAGMFGQEITIPDKSSLFRNPGKSADLPHFAGSPIIRRPCLAQARRGFCAAIYWRAR